MGHFVLGQWGAMCGNPTEGPVQPTPGVGLGTVFTRAYFSWGRLCTKGESSSSGNAGYLSQTLALSIDYRRSRRKELASPKDSFCQHLAQLCPLGMTDCCEDVKAAGHLCILKLIFCVPLPICSFSWCWDREENLQKSQQRIRTAW